MLKNYPLLSPLFSLPVRPPGGAYGAITPAVLHARLIANDTLLILDVREFSEYTLDGHIAEPTGQLPLTPVCMPWTTNVLRANHGKLPRNIDIIVHCRSGGRSAWASAFLDSLGFTRIFNMTGGFNAWTYEKRTGGFGDGSGHWIRSTITRPDTVNHDSGTVVFYPASFPAWIPCIAKFTLPMANNRRPATFRHRALRAFFA